MDRRTKNRDDFDNINELKKSARSILNCEVKDPTGLNDFQKLPNNDQIAIPKVGINRFRIPLQFKHADGTIMGHDAEASMSIYLAPEKTGVNMSRFPVILQELALQKCVDKDFYREALETIRLRLRDYDTENPVRKADLKLKFNYPLKQKSLKSDNWGWQYYACEVNSSIDESGECIMNLIVDYEYSSTCPCSLSMAKQYERDYQNNVTSEGNGVATAHSQRSLARTSVTFHADDYMSIETLIEILRAALPTETQSLVKRVDEQAFAILNGENPVFVEHVARRLSKALDLRTELLDWHVDIEHWESLHSHNAVAHISKVKSNT